MNDNKTILLLAVEKGRTRIVQHILKYCPDLINKLNSGILRVAVSLLKGKDAHVIVRELLQYGFVPGDEFERSEVMYTAISSRSEYTVEELLRHGFDANKSYPLKETIFKEYGGSFMPLHLAVRLNLVSKARLLVRYGADVNRQDGECTTVTPYFGETNMPGDLSTITDMVEFLVKNGANVARIFNLLFLAIEQSDMKFLRFLFELEPSIVNCADIKGFTLLHHAVFESFYGKYVQGLEVIKLLLEKGANVNSKTNAEEIEVLHIAAIQAFSDFRLLEILLKGTADVNKAVTRKGVTPLHISACKRDVFCEFFLRNGANVNAKMFDGKTALHVASSEEYRCPVDFRRRSTTSCRRIIRALVGAPCDRKTVDTLVKYGADLNAEDNNGNTDLHFAALNSRSGKLLIAVLLKHGAVIPRDIVYKTVLYFRDELAISKSIRENLRILVYLGADVEWSDFNRCTPLHRSAELGAKFTLDLLNMGSDVNAVNHENLTPLEVALKAARSCPASDRSNQRSKNLHDTVIPVLRQHVIKLKAAGLHVNEKNKVALSSSWDDDFYDKCKREVIAMKNEKIGEFCITHYDILTSSRNHLVRLARNEGLVHDFDVKKIREKFPNYAYRLELQVARLKLFPRRASLLELCVDVFCNCIADLPDLCVDGILNPLSDDDLENLVLARYQQQVFPKFTPFMWPESLFEVSLGDNEDMNRIWVLDDV